MLNHELVHQRIVSVDLVAAAQRSEELSSIPRPELERDALDYERFLLLVREHPDQCVAPTKAIDRMWHLHMCHPRAYAADCVALFGEILDHDGGFGSTPEEEPILKATFKATARLWEAAYGVPYVGAPTACTRNCVSRCQRRCKSREAPSRVWRDRRPVPRPSTASASVEERDELPEGTCEQVETAERSRALCRSDRCGADDLEPQRLG